MRDQTNRVFFRDVAYKVRSFDVLPETADRLRQTAWKRNVTTASIVREACASANKISEAALVRYLDYLDEQEKKEEERS